MKAVRQHEYSNTQNNCYCHKCNTFFKFKPDECYWDEKGFGYSTKLVKHKECGCINIIQHVEDYSLDVNNDDRFYL